jgi:hypothetical protein
MKPYLFIISFIFISAFSALICVLFFLSPKDFPVIAPILFFLTLFLSSFSFFSLTAYQIRRIFTPKINKFLSLNLSIRQALFLSFFTIYIAYLFKIRAFTWWSTLLGLIFLLFLEIIFIIYIDKQE